MTKVRSVRRTHYTTITNDFLRDDSLSLEARGLLSICLSYADEWNFTLKQLGKVANKGRDTIGKYMKELIDNGYVYRERLRDKKGRLSNYDYVFSDLKEDINFYISNNIEPKTEIQTQVDSPMSEIPTQVNPTQEFPTTLEENKKEKNKKELKKINKKSFFNSKSKNVNNAINNFNIEHEIAKQTEFKTTKQKEKACYNYLMRCNFNDEQARKIINNNFLHSEFWKWKFQLNSQKLNFESMDTEHRYHSFNFWLKSAQI